MSRMQRPDDEETPLLQRSGSPPRRQDPAPDHHVEVIDFSKEDDSNPKLWPRRRKMMNVFVIALMAILSPLASSMFTPGIGEIAKCLNTTQAAVIGATTGYVVTLGVGPMILAPLSETFGRRELYMWCFTIFTLLQIPAALAPNVETLVAARTFAGFFGSVGIANGGGTLSDMFAPSERASIFGWYLLGPLLGPTIGPLLGGIVVEKLDWHWVFWILTIVCGVNTLLGFFFLEESYAPVILAKRCDEAAKMYNQPRSQYTFPNEDSRPLSTKLLIAIQRPTKILLTQPIVQVMALYQAVIFSTMYSLYTNMQEIYMGDPYHMTTTQVGALYVAPGIGFLLAVWFLVPQIDTTYNTLAKRTPDGQGKPEYRLPMANVGAVLLPVSMFWFAWTIEYKTHWAASISSTILWGFGQVSIFNTVQNYYIDAFSQYAASAIAAGAIIRSLFGGVVPAFTPALFGKLGYGWGWSLFGFLCVLLAPAPLLFMKYGERIRERFAIEL
ncbi:MAG: hypothetical protein Q9162_000774 [Coniocarpon cinnabarinum]